jgi:hypothetical protein
MHNLQQNQPTQQDQPNNNNNMSAEQTESLQFHPFEINGQKYLLCKLPNEPFSTLHDPETKQMVGQWNNDTAQYVLYPLGNLRVITPAAHLKKTLEQQQQQQQQHQQQEDQEFERHMKELIASGNAFKIVE